MAEADAQLDSFGLEFSSGFIPYGDEWRFHRRLFQQGFRSAAVRAVHYPMLLRKARMLAHAFLDVPEDYQRHLRKYATQPFTSDTTV